MDESPDARLTDRQMMIARSFRDLLRLAPEVHDTLAKQAELGATDLAALDRLTSGDGPVGVVELGRRLGITSASATVLVDRLVAAGHVERVPHPTDKRRRVVQVTPRAHEHLHDVVAPLTDRIRAVTARLDDESSRVVLDYVREVYAVLHDFAGSDHAVDRDHSSPIGEDHDGQPGARDEPPEEGR